VSTNDVILLNQLLKEKRELNGDNIPESEFFELFTAEQILKDDDLSYDDLEAGIVDGSGDGGIDSIFFFINGILYSEDGDYSLLKKGASLRLVLIQSKTSEGFSEDGINKMISSANDFFDLGKDIETLQSVYNGKLLSKIQEFQEVYINLSPKFPELIIEYYYATKAIHLHDNVERKTPELEKTIKNAFTPVQFEFKFLSATELLSLARNSPSKSSSLLLAENPISTGTDGFVCLVSIKEYLKFIIDEQNQLRTYMFEGNVRDYQGKNEVNKDIQNTLENTTVEDFWWLNNGVSIICSEANLSSQKSLIMQDAEIVNGLQTSKEIFNTLLDKDLSEEKRNILVRVLKPANEESRDRIIKATNSQTPIPPASLRATDKIHRDIDEYLLPKGYFYDRRKNFYKNSGKPQKKILTIPFVAQSVMACALTNPSNARARPSSLLKSDDSYSRIFNAVYPLDIYWKCPVIVREVERILKELEGDHYKLSITKETLNKAGP